MNNEIKNARLRMGLAREGLAEISGVSVNVIRALEIGARDTDKAQINTLVGICNALGCRISDVLNDQRLADAMRACETCKAE